MRERLNWSVDWDILCARDIAKLLKDTLGKNIENAGFSAKVRYVKGCGCHYMRVFCMESPPREKPHLGFPQNRWKYQGHLSIYSATVNQCEFRIPYKYIIKGYFLQTHLPNFYPPKLDSRLVNLPLLIYWNVIT